MSGFVDEAQIHVKGGDGGAGSVSFRREAHVDKGGPDGGDGGHGGDVWLEATTNQASLLSFRDHPFRRAEDGTHGSGKRRHGASGDDRVVPVPVGTVVRDRIGTVLCDLAGIGDRWLAAEGGRGGRGNGKFLSNTRRAPAFAEQGEKGEERWLDAELKLMADAALVGFPNAGKSTLISVVSAAKPKIADYPFTTLEPHLGVVRVTEDEEFVLADIPGLIEGAADGKGLGHRFLRHVERSRVLVVLLDLTALETPPQAQLDILLKELGAYRPELLERPRIVVASKADVAEIPDGLAVDLAIAAVAGTGVPELVFRIAALVREARVEAEEAADDGAVVIHRPVPEGITVERHDQGGWVVLGRAAVRAVGFSDLNDHGALDEATKRLRRLGIDKVLARAGAHDGDEVRVGEISFTWYRDGSARPMVDEEKARKVRTKKKGARR